MDKKEYAQLCFDTKYMQDYIEKETFKVIELSNGACGIEKPSIKKDFCFGYGYCGVSSTEEMEQADNMAKASRKRDYFMKENMAGIEESIYVLTKAIEEDNFFDYNYRTTCVLLCKQYKNNDKISCWFTRDTSNVYGEISKESIAKASGASCVLPTKEDLQLLLDAYIELKENFLKRLNTWWKKYGESHINSWSYLVD